MTNTEYLEQIGELDDIRERLNWKEGRDTASYDARINKMTATEIVREWSGWHIGDPAWAGMIIGLYEGIKEKCVASDSNSD